MRALSCHVPLLSLAILLGGCGEVWNNPYPSQDGGGNILYSAFTERPKHLDPVQSYSEDEAEFNSQIYEPPLQYHYLKRPYELVPLTAEAVPRPRYVDAAGRAVAAESPKVAFSVYEIRIRPGILYQPHPAFARDGDGKLRYHDLARQDLQGVHSLRDFPHSGTRELTAEDYVYQIKRLAHPRLHSPVFGLMSEYIVGLKEFAERLKQADAALAAGGRRNAWLDLSQFPLEGVEAVDRYTYRIRIRGRYPQFAYWLAMNFFAPVPLEVDRFFAQPGMLEKNLTLDWYPVGTGPYMLTENNPNARMVLERNPNFRGEPYPSAGEPADAGAGLFADAGKRMPFIDKVVFSRIPSMASFTPTYASAGGLTQISAALRLLESFGSAKVLSSPKISALNNQAALLKVTEDIVYFTMDANFVGATSTSSGTLTVTSRPNTVSVGFVMSVMPQVGESDQVTLILRPTLSRVVSYVNDPAVSINLAIARASGADVPEVVSKVPQIQTRELESVIKVRSGDTAVLGGLMRENFASNTDQTPGLGNVPGLGELFKYKNRDNAKSELVIFLRPTVVTDASLGGDHQAFEPHLSEALRAMPDQAPYPPGSLQAPRRQP